MPLPSTTSSPRAMPERPPRVLFVDAGAFIGLLSRRDQYHSLARAFWSGLSLRTRYVTHRLVLSEAYTQLACRNRQLGLELLAMVEELEADARLYVFERIDWAEVHELLGGSALKLSYADAASVVACRRLGVDDVFGFDADLASYGLRLHPGT
jgi:predicted nucleic acid-binding protein